MSYCHMDLALTVGCVMEKADLYFVLPTLVLVHCLPLP
jgi:hypothetical protein